ncbi:MAG: thioredoxin-disulfide reductase [Caldisericia bacterium]|nr:thioredoxin-disulfide reductase [Caldisericia bacterium]
MDVRTFDLIIIGGGPAGLSAGIYGGRSLLKTAIIEKIGTGGQLNITDNIANYPGFPDEISGYELGAKMLKQTQNFGTEIIYDEVRGLENDGIWRIVKGAGVTYRAKAVILATGVSSRKLDVPSEGRLRGKGVSYCGTCDGAFFKDKIISVAGGGDTAIEEAVYLTQFGSQVHIIHRRQGFRAAPKNIERAKQNPKINFILDTVIESIRGKEKVERLILKNKITGEVTEHLTDAIFVFIGFIPNTDFLAGYIELNKDNYIIANRDMSTSIPGVFVAGDVSLKDHKQIVTAVSDGAIASMNAWKYISELKGE